MNCRQWVWLLLTSACLIGAAPGAPAQTVALSEDKLVILEQLPKPAGANLEDLFKHLNNSSQDMNLAEQLRKSGVTADQLKKLAESPNLPDLIQEMQKNLGSDSSKIPPQLREALKGMSKDKIQSTLSRERLQQLQQAVARGGQGKGLWPGASIYKKGSPPAPPPVPVK